MRKLTTIICLTLAVLLGSTGDSQSSSETPYLTGEQIRALVSGNEMDFQHTYPTVVNFEKDGDLVACLGSYTEYGTSSLSNNPICMQFDDTILDNRKNCFLLTISGITVKAFNRARGDNETWDFYEIPDAFASLPAEPAGKKKAAGEKKRQALAKKAAEEKQLRALAKKAAEEKKRQANKKRLADKKNYTPQQWRRSVKTTACFPKATAFRWAYK